MWPQLSGKRVSPTLKESLEQIKSFFCPQWWSEPRTCIKTDTVCPMRPVPTRGIMSVLINWGAGPKRQRTVFYFQESCRSGEPPFGWVHWAALWLGWPGKLSDLFLCPVAAFKGHVLDTQCPEGPLPSSFLLSPRGELFLILLMGLTLLMGLPFSPRLGGERDFTNKQNYIRESS